MNAEIDAGIARGQYPPGEKVLIIADLRKLIELAQPSSYRE
jgi:hypothetical protein